MAVSLPHFDSWFRFDATGKPVVVEQGSPAEIGACVANVVACPQGAKLNDPNFGIPSPLFESLPIDLDPIMQAIQTHEPRAAMSGEQAIGGIDLVTIQQIVEQALLPGLGVLPGPGLLPNPGIAMTTTTVQGGPGVVTVDLTATVTSQED